MKLRKIIFWTHLLAGVIAGLVIFIMSFTGVVLMYDQCWSTPGETRTINNQRSINSSNSYDRDWTKDR
jgi:hypothetical protein